MKLDRNSTDAVMDAETLPKSALTHIPAERAKQRTAIQRDVMWLLDELAPEVPPPKKSEELPPTIRRHRSPGRCILQSESRAVTVSWFPAQPDSGMFGELVVTTWSGTVSLPGSARRASVAAKPIATLLLHPIATTEGWLWQTADGKREFMIPALAARCRTMLEG
jgi:hypothetical protein